MTEEPRGRDHRRVHAGQARQVQDLQPDDPEGGPNFGTDGSEGIVWEHGRRNFSLRAEGLLSIVCPVPDDSEVCGIGIFNADADRVRELMDGDPGVQAGIFVYEIHPCRGFPGDALA